MIIGEKVATLRTAATAGDPEAARELGRLLCLLPVDPESWEPHTVEDDWGATWPAEPWLRKAVSALPGDALGKVLLAGVLLSQIDDWQHVWAIGSPELVEAEVDAAISHRHAEAEQLYSEVLAADQCHRTARAGLAALAELFDDGDHPADRWEGRLGYSFYRVELETGSGSVNYLESLIVADPDELRWACDVWLGLFYPDSSFGSDGLTLITYSRGEETGRIALAEPARGARRARRIEAIPVHLYAALLSVRVPKEGTQINVPSEAATLDQPQIGALAIVVVVGLQLNDVGIGIVDVHVPQNRADVGTVL